MLAQGLVWMYASRGQRSSVYVEHRDGRAYYQRNIATRTPVGAKGQHLRKDPAEVRRVVTPQVDDDEWVFDLETESRKFCVGVGGLVVHNFAAPGPRVRHPQDQLARRGEDEAEDYVVATGETHTVRECAEIAFDQAGLPDWERHVVLDENLLRPAEVDLLVGDASKARERLGREPRTSFEQLIRLMPDADLRLLSR